MLIGDSRERESSSSAETCLFRHLLVGEIIASTYLEVLRQIGVHVGVELVDVQFRIVLSVAFGIFDDRFDFVVNGLRDGRHRYYWETDREIGPYFEFFVGG